jgi:hypothetical protein
MLAEARSFDEVRNVRDEMEHVKLHGRQIKDRRLIAEATEVQTRAERRLGELLLEAESLGWIGRGRPKKPSEENVTTPVHFTLDEAGIDRNLSSRAQKLAKVPQEQFEHGVSDVRDRIISGGVTNINGARAIMGSRQEADDSLDFFPTPPWATRALIEHVFEKLERRGHCKFQNAWEPACGEGHMAEILREYFLRVIASDIHDYGYPDTKVADFRKGPSLRNADWIITNPPFGDVGESFVLNAIDAAGTGVAMFMRVQWLDSIGRYERIFRDRPPTLIAFFAERVNLCKGHWDPEGSTATAYMWLVWIKGAEPRAPFWIPPGCRETLTKPDDVERFTQHPVKCLETPEEDEAA